ncbi:hypothetical protein, partial [Escherichia coli]|uniref:hypothetical protein n=1 Tax=Escherichia coli TaxID=562 RepID=UPI001BE420F0
SERLGRIFNSIRFLPCRPIRRASRNIPACHLLFMSYYDLMKITSEAMHLAGVRAEREETIAFL